VAVAFVPDSSEYGALTQIWPTNWKPTWIPAEFDCEGDQSAIPQPFVA
jgi:hypothetical protein